MGDTSAESRTAPRFDRGEARPLFSIVCAMGGSRSTASVAAAMRAQSCPDFEVLAFDVADDPGGTASLLSAAEADPRIRVVHAAGSSNAERLLQALRQCRGTYIGFWPDRGKLAPDALAHAAQELERMSDIGGLCGSGFLRDAYGRSLDQVDIITLLLTTYRPYLPAGFIVRDALLSCGLDRDDWHVEAIELEVWCRLAIEFGLRSTQSKFVADDESPGRDVLARPTSIDKTVAAYQELVGRAFSRDGLFGDTNPSLLLESKVNQLSILLERLLALGESEDSRALRRHLEAIDNELRVLLASDHRVLETLHRLTWNRGHALGRTAAPLRKLLALSERLPGRLPIHARYTLWNFPLVGPWLSRTMIADPPPAARTAALDPFQAAPFASLYAVMGELFSNRGQNALALEMWTNARPPRDPMIDGLACQVLLKLPELSEAEVVAQHAKWIGTHVRDSGTRSLGIPARRKDRIRIGYHCSFMNSPTIRHQMRNVVAAHDRQRFEIYGYSPHALAPDNTIAFDTFRHTPPLNERPGDNFHSGEAPRLGDAEFADLVRRDGIDVLVELSGFSPGNRFLAMSKRCAPIQVSYINHLGSTQIPNLDYVFSDAIATPPGWPYERLYSESLYRLPGCFFCYDYRDFDGPPVVDPPSTRKGFVTFGCFGSGAKFNIELIEMWATLLRRVPGAKLRVQNLELSSRENRRFLADRFGRFGIGRDRVVIEGGVDRPTLLAVYDEIDISLDTWPYCGGNTTAESLWQGVPVVTLKDERFAGAYGASLLAAAGCSDLVAHSPDQYVDIAARLAGDRTRLEFLRRNLRAMSVDHGLGDSESMARRLEAAYLDMMTRLRSEQAGVRPGSAREAATKGLDERMAAAKAADVLP